MLVFFLAALIPLLVGALYYSPAVAGKAWMRTNGFTEDSLKGGNMALIFGLSYVFGLFLSYVLYELTVHQTGMTGVLAMDPTFATEGSETYLYYQDFLERFGDRHRTFGHGALHGFFIAGIGFALPLIAINALFERRGWTYIGVHLGYWLITLTLMGGVLCQFALR